MLKVRRLPVELAKIAQMELNEDPTNIAGHVAELRNWILQQPHLIARTG